MNIIVLQGINGHVGTSSICAALTYSLCKIDIRAIAIDAALYSRGAAMSNYFAFEPDSSCDWTDAVTKHKSLSNQKNANNIVYCYSTNVYFAPLKGNCDRQFDKDSAKTLAASLHETLSNTKGIDFAIIDAGVRGNYFANAMAEYADMLITVCEADGNCLNRINDTKVMDNEYLLLNKVARNSKLMNDIVTLLRESKLKNVILNADISYDETVMSAFLYETPYPRYLSIAAASLDIEKLMFEIILISNTVNG